MNIAIDFVSPENVDRCEILTREFREQSQSMEWNEDVFQLRTMMWFAWLSCKNHEAIQGKETNTSGTVAITSASNNESLGQAGKSRMPSGFVPVGIDGDIVIPHLNWMYPLPMSA